MSVLKTAVIGVGWIGTSHARILSENDRVKLKAVCDTDLDRARKIADRYNINYYQDYSEMFQKEDLDAVIIATPPETHKKIAIDAINQNLNILLEKPIATTIEDAQKIAETAINKGIKIMVGHTERFNPAVRKLKELLEENKLGKIYKIDIRRVGPFPERISDVGVVIDLAVHDIDVINYLFSPKIANVYAETMKMLHPKHEDLLTAIIRFDNGVQAVLNINWLTPYKTRKLSIIGEKGRLMVNYLTQEVIFQENSYYSSITTNNPNNPNNKGMAEGNMTKILIDKKEPLQSEIEAFVDYILKNTSPPITLKDSLDALNLANHIIKVSNK